MPWHPLPEFPGFFSAPKLQRSRSSIARKFSSRSPALRVDSHVPAWTGLPLKLLLPQSSGHRARVASVVLAAEIPVGKAPLGESQHALLIYRPNSHILGLHRGSLLAALTGRIEFGQPVQRLQLLKEIVANVKKRLENAGGRRC
ncbi:hypothetical protein HWV62_37199 [Athelia sp. TMB]|nr:hypothetical protein HWV62_37199 [Athelia sp. TMB]